MVGRLGVVLYFAFAGIAALLVLAAVMFANNNPHEPATAGALAFFGVVSFLIGLASKYVLAGGS